MNEMEADIEGEISRTSNYGTNKLMAILRKFLTQNLPKKFIQVSHSSLVRNPKIRRTQVEIDNMTKKG